MSVFKNFLGTMSQYLKIGGPSGPRVKNNSGTFELRNTGDSSFATGRAAHIQSGAAVNDIVSLLDLQGRVPNITWSFDGASPPSPGANTGQFGIVHTTGGGYTQGRVYYDDGTSLILMPTEVVRSITTASAVSGGVSLIANGVYALQGGSWVLKGDGTGAVTGLSRWVEVPFDYNDAGTPVDSTTSIADGARVLGSRFVVETAFDGSPTVQVTINGSSPETIMGTSQNDPTETEEYQTDLTHKITSSNEGLVRVTLTATAPTAGAGYVLVEYATPLA